MDPAVDWTFNLACPNCSVMCAVHFGRRSTDTSILKWRHKGCEVYNQGVRCDDADYLTMSLPADENGIALPPAE